MKTVIKTHCSVIALMAALSQPVLAQQTTSEIRGVVTDESQQPLANTTVVIVNGETGLSRTLVTNANGEFLARNLPVSDDYDISISLDGYTSKRAEDLPLTLGQTAELSFMLSTASDTMEEVEVVATKSVTQQLAMGPNAAFGLEKLESAPAINRNIADVLRADPRIYVDESRGDVNSISCGGQNPRFNSLTVDGVRMNDSFGLNDNGYPTERMPFSYDAINQVAVEMAPFDVEYGGFTACNINAVTKSGGNEFSGSAFYDYTDNDLRGDSLEGDDIQTGDYDEKRYGFTLGGPLIQDKLFFFAAYEKLEGANLFDRGAIGSGAVNEVNVTAAELAEIADIASNLYGYDVGSLPSSLANEDEKLLVKLDWYITDNHRMAFTYNYNDGNNFVEADGDLSEIEFSNHLYERGAELNSYVASFYSDWTDNFSTEFRVSYLDLDNRQIPVGGTDFGEIRVALEDVDVYLGADDSRHANKLEYDSLTFAFKGNYLLGDHSLTFGVEREDLDVFNMFVQHAETEIRFDGIDNFRNGYADAIYYNNAPSNDPTDAAADWGYAMNTVYLQDEFMPIDNVTVIAGLRYDWYTSSDKPEENAEFVADYGFSNTATLDGEGLLQPRFAVNWAATDALTVRSGLGLFSGGNPNVWMSNSFSGNNVLQFGARGGDYGYTDGSRSLFDDDVVYEAVEDGVPAGPGYGVPSELYDAVATGTGSNNDINYLDPDFDIPSEWKFNLGATYITDSEYIFNADLIVSRGKDSAVIKHGDLEQTGTTAEGYPIYESVRTGSLVLTNSDKGNRSTNVSLSVAKAYDNGFDWTVGYAFSDAEDVQPMNSSVAFSNYVQRAFFDPEADELSTSNYNIRHRFTATANWNLYLLGDNRTTISLYASTNEGVPYSYAYDGTEDPYSFTPYLDYRNNVLEPGTSRNSEEGSWWTKVDLKIQQEFAGFGDTDKVSAYMVVDNLTNLLNDEWGILRQADFPNTVNVDANQDESRIGDASRYEIRFGLQYQF